MELLFDITYAKPLADATTVSGVWLFLFSNGSLKIRNKLIDKSFWHLLCDMLYHQKRDSIPRIVAKCTTYECLTDEMIQCLYCLLTQIIFEWFLNNCSIYQLHLLKTTIILVFLLFENY